MQNFPETPEGVALFLMNLIIELRRAKGCYELPRVEVLDLYVECLRASNGCREVSHLRRNH